MPRRLYLGGTIVQRLEGYVATEVSAANYVGVFGTVQMLTVGGGTETAWGMGSSSCSEDSVSPI